MKNTVLTFAKAKEDGVKLSMLTSYDYSMARQIFAIIISLTLTFIN